VKKTPKQPSVESTNVIAYARVSTAEQAKSGLGLQAQLSAIRAHAKAHGLAISQTYIDEGVSAKTLDRPELTAALAALASGETSGIIVSKVDRLSRSLADLLDIVDNATKQGWRLVALDMGLDTATPGGRFTLSLLGAVSELERNLISERTKSALAAKKAHGARLGRPVEYPPEVRTRILNERNAGRTLAAIAEGLTADGVPTPRGGKWSRGGLSSLLASIDLDQQAAKAAQT
jgi:DNA invertase Pin-like site-specific DNA recombinase